MKVLIQELLRLSCYHFYYLLLAEYRKIKIATLCGDQDLDEIKSADQCKDAGEQLGLKWNGTYDGPNDFPGCIHAEDGRNKVYFNTNAKPGFTNLKKTYAAICIVPFGKMNSLK